MKYRPKGIKVIKMNGIHLSEKRTFWNFMEQISREIGTVNEIAQVIA